MRKMKKLSLLLALALTISICMPVKADECSTDGCNFAVNSNAWYVCGLFRCMLGRLPGDQGQANWTSKLDSGMLTRKNLVICIMHSPEYRGRYVSNCEFVQKTFEFLLLRAPGAQGLENYVGQLNSGKLTRLGLIQVITASPEYAQKHAYIPSC